VQSPTLAEDVSLPGLGVPLFEGRRRTTIVVVDMVESVRFIEQEESTVVARSRHPPAVSGATC
jgi:hypothetical protein